MTLEQHKAAIEAAVEAAEAEGFSVDIENCCGCTDITVELGNRDGYLSLDIR